MEQKRVVAILIALVVILSGTTIYFAAQKYAYAPTVSQSSLAKKQSMAGQIPANQKSQTNQNQSAANDQLSAYNPQSLEIKPVNSEWNTYTSKKFGFSMNIPQKIYKGDADPGVDKNCTGYRPVTAFEDDTHAFIVSDYGNVPGFSEDECTKNTLNFLSSTMSKGDNGNIDGLVLNIFSVPTENDIAKVIEEMYGCKTSFSKKQSGQLDTYDISINPTDNCVMNFGYFFKYSPKMKKAAVWNNGQDWRMLKGPQKEDAEENGGYDREIAKSFKFIN
jgi:hypothetical protein